MTAPSIRFATWNVSYQGAVEPKVQFLDSQDWDLLALQEVTPAMESMIRDAGVADAFEYPADRHGERFGSALLARGGFALDAVSLIADLPHPSRGVHARATRGDIKFEVLSWHAPHGVDKGGGDENRQRKRAGYGAFIAWVEAQMGPLVVGTDANHGAAGGWGVREEDFPGSPMKLGAPKDWGLEESRWWIQEAPDLRDAWIEYLREQPDVLAEVRANWTGGPSAVSYYRGKKHPDRFDYVLVSSEFSVKRVEYHPLENKLCAGSDHTFLSAELALEGPKG